MTVDPAASVPRFKERFESDFTYLNGFLRNARRFANHPAVTDALDGKTLTYRQLNRAANRIANALLRSGVEPGGVVAFALTNSVDFATLYIAPKKIDAVSCPVNFLMTHGELADLLDDSRPIVFFYEAAYKETAEMAFALANHQPARTVMVGDPNVGSFVGSITLEDYLAGVSDDDPEVTPVATAYDETTRMYTSGTTGLFKGVPLNNVAEILTAHDVIMQLALSPFDKTMNMTPWFHRGGLYAGGPDPTLYIGGQCIAMPHFHAEQCLDAVERYRVTFLIGSPANARALCDAQEDRHRDLSSLKGIVTMGSPLEREMCVRIQTVLTPNVFNGYGTTEAFWNTLLRPYDLPEMSGTAGRSCIDDDVAIVKIYPGRLAHPSDVVAKNNGEVGEIIVRAPAKWSCGYVNDPALTSRTFRDGWMYIGDLAKWDENEFVTIVGRKADMFSSNGENVYPALVEEAINAHSQVAECIVVGVPDYTGVGVAAYVIRRDPTLTAAQLADHCANQPSLGKNSRPRYFRFVETLPFNAIGKKQHYKIKRQAAEEFAAGLLAPV